MKIIEAIRDWLLMAWETVKTPEFWMVPKEDSTKEDKEVSEDVEVQADGKD